MLKTNLIALDLEMNQPTKTIIQVGLAVGNTVTGQLIMQEAIDIHTHEILNPDIIELTGISQEQVNGGVALTAAYDRMVALANLYDVFINPLTWGGGDSETLRQQLNMSNQNWRFGRRWIDAKTLFIAWRMSQQKEVQGGLARAMTKLGLAFKGRKHNAGDDAANTFRIYHKLLQEFSKNSIDDKGTV